MKQKKSNWCALLCIALVPVLALFSHLLYQKGGGRAIAKVENSFVLGYGEDYLKATIPFSRTMQKMAIQLKYMSGTREQEDIFILKSSLVKNVKPPGRELADANSEAVIVFFENGGFANRPAYFMLLPTASGFPNREFPQYSQPYNQRSLIESTNNKLSSFVSIIYTYNTLLENSKKYIYYKTENNITPIGGYYIFEQMLKRMLGEAPPTENEFDVAYKTHDYYGELYWELPVGGVSPDIIMEYRYNRPAREYVVARIATGEATVRKSLYSEEEIEVTKPSLQDYYPLLGTRTHIYSNAGNGHKLLVLADDTVISYLPFLAHYYEEIAIVNMNYPEEVEKIRSEDYTQLLIACSTETYLLSDNLAKILNELQ